MRSAGNAIDMEFNRSKGVLRASRVGGSRSIIAATTASGLRIHQAKTLIRTGLPQRGTMMYRFRYLVLVGISVLAALVDIIPAQAAVNHNESFVKVLRD